MQYRHLHDRRPSLARGAAAAFVSALLTAGCAVVPDPAEKLATARAAIGSATSSGARELAAFELAQAIEKQKAAEEAAAVNDRERATALAEQASLDARVADAKARAAKARKAASDLQEANRALQEEMMRRAN